MREKLIETLETFKREGIRTDAKQTADYQDLVMRETPKTITDVYMTLSQDHKRLFVWTCGCSFDFETFTKIMKWTVIHGERMRLYEDFDEAFNKRSAELDARSEEISKTEREVEDRRQGWETEIEELRANLKQSKWELERQTEARNWLSAELERIRQILENQNDLRAALKTLGRAFVEAQL